MTTTDGNPDRYVRFQMIWPEWLRKQVHAAAGRRTLSVAAWMREAAIEKLERDRP